MFPKSVLLLSSGIMFVASSARAAPTSLEVKAGGAKTFYADDRAGNNQASFISQSTIEDFTGVCNKIGGECTMDPRNIESFKGSFWVKVEDLRTGIDLRDRHLRSPDWLDAAKYPKIEINVAKVEQVKKLAANTASMVMIGSAAIRGKTHDVRIIATLTYLDETPQTMKRVKGDLIRIRAEFDIKLADFGITGPPGSDTIGLKVAETQQIKVTVFGSTEKPPPPLAPGKDAPEIPGAVKPKPPTRPPG
jgi:polyisoprenoid-binding protein YceI